MAIAFSRSLRALQGDSHRPAVATVIAASLLVVTWFAWLVFGRIELYQSSQDWQTEGRSALIVRFPIDAMKRLRPGQPATVEFLTDANQPPAQVNAVVADTPSRTQNRLAQDTVKVALLGAFQIGRASCRERV